MAIHPLVLVLPFTIFLVHQSEATSTKITYYNLVVEKDYKLGSDSILATCEGKTLAKSSKEFADKIALEGSGALRDGKFLNLGSCVSGGNKCRPKGNKYSCFERGSTAVGSQDNPLVPFVSVAALKSNEFKFGTTGIIKDFVGKKTPKGETHNGCVRVDDDCSTCQENAHLDFYAYSHGNVKFFEENWKDSDQRVEFTPSKCKPLKYKY